MITKVINVNLHQPIYERLTAKQGDIASRYLLFHLLDGDKPFDLTGKSVRVYARKPDKTEIFNDLIINDETKGYCTLELTSQCLAAAGVVKMELYISESGKVLTSIPFELEVIACINTANGVTSTNEFSALEVALSSLQDYDNLRGEIIQARKTHGTVGERLDNFDSQLDTIKNNVGNTGIKNGGRTSRIMVSFTDDDCNIEVYTILKPLLDSKGIKATFAIPTGVIGTEGFMNESQVKELYNDGHDFMWHGHNLINFTQVSREQLKEEYDESMKKLAEWGFKPFSAVAYPQGSTNFFIRSFASEFFNCGIDVWRGWVNKVPYPQYMMSRIHFGEPNNQGMKEHLDSPYDTNTLEFYKYCVDKAIEDGQWLIFMTHAWYKTFDETQRQYLLDTIDYIKSKNIDIVTISEGLRKTGNLLTAGERTPMLKNDNKYFNIGANGAVDSNMIDVYIAQPDRYTSSHQPWEFEKGKVTKNLITYHESTVHSYPANKYGVLITDATGTMNGVKEQIKECIRQTFIANTTGNRYTRNSNSDGTKWTNWKEENICYISDKDTFDCTMPPNKFPLDKIIYNVITPTKVSQSPEAYPLGQYGILTTYTTGISWDGYTNYEMMRQEYTCQSSGLKYFRVSNSNGTSWNAWKTINITQYGSKELRPTKNVQIGQMYFDYTLQKPIWCNQITPTVTWCDATGTVV